MMENRSFDHYYGTYRGARGFDDHPTGSLGAFSQVYPGGPGNLLPFRFDRVANPDQATCTRDLTHSWAPQHQVWNGGKMDSFVRVHTGPDNEGPAGVNTMGYYTRADLPFYYALADAFTLCDGYHCSVLGPTHPNRLMHVSASIDPTGSHGGPVIVTAESPDAIFSVNWDTMPEVLEDAGISWKYYNPAGAIFSIESMQKVGFISDAILPYFSQFSNPAAPLYQKAFLPTYPDDFSADVKSGNLPQVSWICPPAGYDEHPPSASFLGEWFTSQVLATLISQPELWAKTVIFHTYDENDGFFDHVPPPVPRAGTAGEFLTVNPLPAAAGGIDGPIGLGMRVPMTVISPFSRGGYVCSDTFDHTSQLRFLEERFGVRAPNLSSWRRGAVGDLTSTLHMSRRDLSVPSLPPTHDDPGLAPEDGCTSGDFLEIGSPPPYPVPVDLSMPRQEPGRARRLSSSLR